MRPTALVWLCASVLFHAGAIAAVRAMPEEPGASETSPALVALEVQAPEPPAEPEPPPVEEPPIDPEPEPPAPAKPLVRPDPEPEPEPEPREEPPEPQEALANADDDPPDEAPEDAPLEQEAAPDHMTGQGMATSEGGLAVAARAGDGSGLRGGRTFRPGRPTPDEPSIDTKALAQRWWARVRRLIHTRAAREYPLSARRRHLEGAVRVGIRVDADGRIVGVEVERSSGHRTLDEAAVATIRRLGQVTPPPEVLRWSGRKPLPMRITYRFQ